MINEKIFEEDLLKFLKDVLNLCNKNSDKLNYDDEKWPIFFPDGKYKKYETISDIILFDSKGMEKSLSFDHSLLIYSLPLFFEDISLLFLYVFLQLLDFFDQRFQIFFI